jgi:hypothetical protein
MDASRQHEMRESVPNFWEAWCRALRRSVRACLGRMGSNRFSVL